MSGCCDQECGFDSRQQGATLQAVLVINALMFVVIVGAAIYAGSSALLSDSLDNLGDAITYGISLYAVGRSQAVKARVALLKGGLIFMAACVVLVQVAYKLVDPFTPVFEVMGIFSVAALGANGLCVFLLWRHRHHDINMHSVWECARNDIVANLGVLVAAGAIWLTDSGWPDIIVALCLSFYLLRSSLRVFSNALRTLRHNA